MNKIGILMLLTAIPTFNAFANNESSSTSIIKKRLEYCTQFLPDDGKERVLNIDMVITKDKKLTDSSVSLTYKNPDDIAKLKAELEKTKAPQKHKDLFLEKEFMECIIEHEATFTDTTEQ